MPPPAVRRIPSALREEVQAVVTLRKTRYLDRKRKLSNAYISLQNKKFENDGANSVAVTDELSKGGDPAKTSPLEPLWPLTIAVKDNIATAEFPTTCGSGILKEYRSPFEAFVAEKARTHGSTIVGKTNMDEFGMGSHSTHSFFGPVGNFPPFNSFSAGGSSGGSAVAVAQGSCQVALGTDTGGSIRLPAAYTGVVGFKPSYGFLSRRGVVPYANSLDTVGIVAKDARSALLMYLRLYKPDPSDPTALSKPSRRRIQQLLQQAGIERQAKARGHTSTFSSLKIGVPIEYNIAELDPAVRRAWENALTLFREQGCTIVPVSLPNTKHALSSYYVLAPAEAASNLSKYDGVRYGSRSPLSDGAGGVLYSQTRGAGFGDEVKRRILLGSYTLSSGAIENYFIKAQKVRRLVQRDFDRVFSFPNPLRPPQQFDLSDMDESVKLENKLGPSAVDFIVCPTAPTLPPTLDEVLKQAPLDAYMNDVFTVPASLAGLPAISVPHEGFIPSVAFKRPDAPRTIGIQIIGQYADDKRVLRTAQTLMELQQEKVQSRPRAKRESRWMRALVSSGLSEKQAVQVIKLVESGLFGEQPTQSAPDLSTANLSSRKETLSQELKKPNENGLKQDSYPKVTRYLSNNKAILEDYDLDQKFVDALSAWEEKDI